MYKFKLISGTVLSFNVTPQSLVNGFQRLERTCFFRLHGRIFYATKM